MIFIYIYIYIYLYIFIYIYTFIYLYKYMFMHVHIYIHMCLYTRYVIDWETWGLQFLHVFNKCSVFCFFTVCALCSMVISMNTSSPHVFHRHILVRDMHHTAGVHPWVNSLIGDCSYSLLIYYR